MSKYHAGQPVYRRGRLYGHVVEVVPMSRLSRDPGGVVVRLMRAVYSGSDLRDDAGIAAGTKFSTAFVSRVQIQGDELMQVGTYMVGEAQAEQ